MWSTGWGMSTGDCGVVWALVMRFDVIIIGIIGAGKVRRRGSSWTMKESGRKIYEGRGRGRVVAGRSSPPRLRSFGVATAQLKAST